MTDLSLRDLVERMPWLVSAFPGKSHPDTVNSALKAVGRNNYGDPVSPAEFKIVLEAKLPGQAIPNILASASGHIKKTTEASFALAKRNDHEGAVSVLCGEPGLGVSLSSALLSWGYCPRTFPVIDRHAWRVYCVLVNPHEKENRAAKSVSLSARQYQRFREGLYQKLAEFPDKAEIQGKELTVSQLDYWMYAFSKVFGSKPLGDPDWFDVSRKAVCGEGYRHA
ncbi:hypothetical protein ACOXXX_16390 [Thalassococcus sp. BH17M4-6]|uniref:hypothetical protein n=1 Tax=Thalassococcus sp. BH17M4-6 TaxID=3413148 RepID=UPI003BE7D105